jgi:hypothetical protein
MNTETPMNQWAIDLLAPDPLYEENFISKYFHYITIPPSCLAMTLTINWFQNRPYFASKLGFAFI